MGVWSLRNSIWLSLTVHTIFFLVCTVLFWKQATVRLPSRLTWVEVAPSEVKPKLPVESSDKNKQVVVTERGRKVDEARPDAFWGERNQRVHEETVGKSQVLGAAQPTLSPSQSKAATAAEGEKAEGKNTPAQPHLLGIYGVPMLSHLKEIGEVNPELERQWASQGQRVQDYVKGIKEGNQTSLNTREFVFFGYFQRIRERLDRAWVPILREKLAKYYYGGRKLASDMDHSTRILVVLNQRGEITRVQVLSESGTRDLDDAAIRAFNQAGPFPNPPVGIIDKSGEIQIPWEFILRT